MSGHSKWAQIKHKKAATDAKKGTLFSKMVREITIAAGDGGPNPDSNPRLRSALERARALGLPKDNIERAIERSSGRGEGVALERFLYEATAPGGVMILIDGISDNKNRTLAEIKKMLVERGAHLVPPHSLLWNFDETWSDNGKNYRPKTTAQVGKEESEKLNLLLRELDEHQDVQETYTNLKE